MTSPSPRVAESLLLSKLDQFDGSSFRQVRLITIVKKIYNRPDVFFCPFAQERVKILIRSHGYLLASDPFLSGRHAPIDFACGNEGGYRTLWDLSPRIHRLFLKGLS
jgi:hypothetical protein